MRWLPIWLWIVPVLCSSGQKMPAEITEDVVTEFGVYHPVLVEYTPAVPEFRPLPDFSNVSNFNLFHFTQGEEEALLKHHFTVRYSWFKQMYDVYVECNWNGIPIFVTTDAVLHIYHVLFDQMLAQIEAVCFMDSLKVLTQSLIQATEALRENATSFQAQKALLYNLAFLHVADQLLGRDPKPVPVEVDSLVSAELDLILNRHDDFYYSPIFGNFSMLDYSQCIPRGHYTKTEDYKAYFRTMMWYGWTIFTMEPLFFGDLARRHTLQALLLVQSLYREPRLFRVWDTIYQPTVFFVGKTDDPNVMQYLDIANRIYGPDFLSLSPDALADSLKLEAFMEQAQRLPGPKIPNYQFPSGFPYKGFRFMGQRFMLDSYLFANLVNPGYRHFPRGLDVMASLGSDRAWTLLDSVYQDTLHFSRLREFQEEFAGFPASTWAQNLYWNWLYCLVPLLVDKGPGYPFFMQTLAWRDRELLTSLASWGELRHDTILYAKQSLTPTGDHPGPLPPPRNYVEPNPVLYARLSALVRYTRDGLHARNLLFQPYEEKLALFETMLHFFKNVAKKELENDPLTYEESALILGFGDAMKELVSGSGDPEKPWETLADDMAVIADVHTDHNSRQCLEEGVGYPLEIDVLVYENGEARICRGALFSYYEFTQPIAERLTDEAWREMLVSDKPPEMVKWVSSFIPQDISRPKPLDKWTREIAYPHQFNSVLPARRDMRAHGFRLVGVYPNPFNPSVTIRFEISRAVPVKVFIFDLAGKKIRTMEKGVLGVGGHEVMWDGLDYLGQQVPSGVYLVQVYAGGIFEVEKVTFMK